LPPRQRAILLLIDVLEWSSADAASLVGGSVTSVNSALLRAHTTLKDMCKLGRQRTLTVSSPSSSRMPRMLCLHGANGIWVESRSVCSSLQYGNSTVSSGCFPSTQPAFALYTQDKTDNRWFAHSLHALDAVDGDISKLTLFVLPKGLNLLTAFGFPLVVEK
jgi:RNA polymerase sigma-70 factor, ECF subfamily